jgi:hypothetical protein
VSTPANQPLLDAAATDARSAAGELYYTGCRVLSDSNSVELYLANAPPRVLERLEAMHPGIYGIHNDAPRPLRAIEEIRKKIDFEEFKRKGIAIVSHGPTVDGYVKVGVMNDVPTAQMKLDAMFGPDVIRVHIDTPKIAC